MKDIKSVDDKYIKLLVRVSIDYNSGVMGIATQLLATDGKPILYKRVIRELQKLGSQYKEDINQIIEKIDDNNPNTN